LSVGHTHLTDKNYAKFKKANKKMFVLGVSDSSCNRCCFTEQVLNYLVETFDSATYAGKKGEKLKVARVDLAERYDFIEKEGISFNNSPSIYVYFDGDYYRYDMESVTDHRNPTTLLH